MKYERPIVLENGELAEGVFTASGSAASTSAGSGLVTLTSADRWGNYTFKNNGIENGATYTVTITALENDKVYGLSSCTFAGKLLSVAGNTATGTLQLWVEDTIYAKLTFSSMGNWERGWELDESDVPPVSVSLTKVG